MQFLSFIKSGYADIKRKMSGCFHNSKLIIAQGEKYDKPEKIIVFHLRK